MPLFYPRVHLLIIYLVRDFKLNFVAAMHTKVRIVYYCHKIY